MVDHLHRGNEQALQSQTKYLKSVKCYYKVSNNGNEKQEEPR